MELINQLDLWILSALKAFHSSFLDCFMVFISSLGNYGLIWFITAVFLLFSPRYRRYGALIIAVLTVGYLVGDVFLKNLVARPRPFLLMPEIELLIKPPSSFSFPSGHTLSSFGAATALLLANRRLGIPALALAFLIAFSRLYLFVHYPSDVLAGIILGTILTLLLFQTAVKLRFFPKEKKPTHREKKEKGLNS